MGKKEKLENFKAEAAIATSWWAWNFLHLHLPSSYGWGCRVHA